MSASPLVSKGQEAGFDVPGWPIAPNVTGCLPSAAYKVGFLLAKCRGKAKEAGKGEHCRVEEYSQAIRDMLGTKSNVLGRGASRASKAKVW
jgi:hypothetical protein